MGTQAHFTDEEARPRGARARQGAGQGAAGGGAALRTPADRLEAKALAGSRLTSEWKQLLMAGYLKGILQPRPG